VWGEERREAVTVITDGAAFRDRRRTVGAHGSRLKGMNPRFFATPAEWREWLADHHDTVPELWVGFHKRGTGRPSITWPESVDQALCFGWIDGMRRRLDDERYAIRFTPRRKGSVWSRVNLERVKELTRGGLMHAAGLAVHAARVPAKSVRYSYEQRQTAKLPAAMVSRFRRNRKAWAFFQAQPVWYRHTAVWWIVSAKREATRERRLATLIEDSAAGRPIKPLTRPGAG
jgi:uncharacterized protein YdeI (YjbR/CyaY-like superfamily)